ncbi:carbamoyl phosphate synthase-like protein [Rickettsiales bacterium Ac37b]|nr:carbamoyl phosphate synthase-like protein [Rickettsiales bacterium Ac37b]
MSLINKKTKVCVFPAGTEIGLEIYRSLNGIKSLELIGANTIEDSSFLLYLNYINVDFDINSIDLAIKLAALCNKYQIDILIPAHDEVIYKLSSKQALFNNTILFMPSAETCEILRFKSKTYKHFKDFISVPKQFSQEDLSAIQNKVFVKPDNGQGSKGTILCENGIEALKYLNNNPDLIATEFLPGDEYTIDCYSNKDGKLLCAVARKRSKIAGGIAITSEVIPSTQNMEFIEMASTINKHIPLWGVWFFQVKRNQHGKLTLLEIANRVPGSYSLSRSQGVNGLEIQLYEALGHHITELPKLPYMGTLYRHLTCQVLLGLNFSCIYVDFDDTIIQNGKVNYLLIAQLYRWRSNNYQIILLTRHKGNLTQSLYEYGLYSLFHKIHHILTEQPKSDFIQHHDAIFIDDSFKERTEVANTKQIYCFSPESAILIAD